MKISSLSLENYRCFDKLNIAFDEHLTVIVGVNGSGKTAILEAVCFFLKIYAEYFSNDVEVFPVGQILSMIKHGKFITHMCCKYCSSENDLKFYEPICIGFKKNNNDNWEFIGNYDPILRFAKEEKENSDKTVVFSLYTSKRILNAESSVEKSNGISKGTVAYAFDAQIDFSSSLAWFIERATQEALEALQKKDLNHTLPDLSAVRMAISKALGDYDEPFIGDTPPALFIRRKGDATQQFRIEELSDGYRTMLALVMDLARRMAVANKHVQWPEGQSVLHSPGIVLIDEVELHLHPSWQQSVLPTLMEIFPNVQFIVTTHSPQVLTSIAAKHIRILKDGMVRSFTDETEGAEASRVLEDVLLVSQRPAKLESVNKLARYAELVYAEKWDSPEATVLREELYNHYGSAEPRLKELDLHIENSKWERGL